MGASHWSISRLQFLLPKYWKYDSTNWERSPYNLGPSIEAAFLSPEIKLYEPGSKITVTNLDISAVNDGNMLAHGAYIKVTVLQAPAIPKRNLASPYIKQGGTYASWSANTSSEQYMVELEIARDTTSVQKNDYINLAQALVNSFQLY